MTLPDLINLLENATGPDRKIDAEIWRSNWPHDQNFPEGDWYPDVAERIYQRIHNGGDDGEVPRFTSSIDGARSLVPESASSWDCGQIDKEFLASVEFAVDADGFHNFHAKSGANAAIALCIASLRARLTPHGGEIW